MYAHIFNNYFPCRPKCNQCDEEFKSKDDRNQHMRRDHRGVERAVERRPRYTPHTIPDGATLLRFGRM